MKLKRIRKGLVTALAVSSVLLTVCGANPLTSNTSSGNQTSSQTTNIEGIDEQTKEELSQLNYTPGTSAIKDVNGGKSTLNPSSWEKNKVIYSSLDSLNRTSSPNTGFLEARNRANESLRVQQTVNPTAWHSNRGGTQIYNRGHMIAYSVSAGIDQNGAYNPNNTSGDQNNPKNLFTQSAFSNQKLQTIYESKVRKAIEKNKRVIYQVTPIFRGNELMARGVNLQAISTDGSLNFNVYIYSVQPGVRFNYADGSSQTDSSMTVPTPADAPTFSNNDQTTTTTSSKETSNYSNSYRHSNWFNNRHYHHSAKSYSNY